MKDNSNKVIAIATVAIALGAAIQAMVSFQQFSINMKSEWTHVGAQIAIGILALVTLSVAFKAWKLSRN